MDSIHDYKAKYMKYKTKYLQFKQLNQLKIKQHNLVGGKDTKTTDTSKTTDTTKTNEPIELYLFKAEWCGHCVAFKSGWAELKNKYVHSNANINSKYNVNANVKFIEYDADNNKDKMKEWGIQGFPTIFLKKGDKAYEYNGPREVESIMKFIKEH